MKHKPAFVFKDDAQKVTGRFSNRHLCTAQPDNKCEHEFTDERPKNRKCSTDKKHSLLSEAHRAQSVTEESPASPKHHPTQTLVYFNKATVHIISGIFGCSLHNPMFCLFFGMWGSLHRLHFVMHSPIPQSTSITAYLLPILQKQEITTLHPVPA